MSFNGFCADVEDSGFATDAAAEAEAAALVLARVLIANQWRDQQRAGRRCRGGG